jgi:Tfp pilus assembly protein PilX
MTARSSDEKGSAVIIAMVLMTVMLAMGLATISFGSGQRQLAVGERVRESAFNLAEAALHSQVFILARTWPGSQATAFPASCSSAAVTTNCPNPTTLSAQFTDAEYTSSSWSTSVQDNGGSVESFYSTAGAASQPSYDANGDGKLWVRSQGTVKGVGRTVITQVKAQAQQIPFPRNTLTAGYFATTNNGRKVMVDTSGGSYSSTPSQPGGLAVRCSTGPRSSCLDYDAGKGQVSPPSYQTNYPPALHVSADQLNTMRGIARSNNTYYSSGCPSSIAGAMVFIENGNCSYSGTYNSLNTSGTVVVATGTLSFGGNGTYYGLVYLGNRQSSAGFLLTMGGCSKIIGSVMVEGQGGVQVGSCGNQIAFNPGVLGLAKGHGWAAPVKSTWREV